MAAIGIFRTKDASKAMGDQLQSLVDRGLVDQGMSTSSAQR